MNIDTPISIKDVSDSSYNISTKVQNSIDEDNDNILFYNITKNPALVNPGPFTSQGTVTIETDTVTGASPYIFNISTICLGYARNGTQTEIRQLVSVQWLLLSLLEFLYKKDDRAFVKYNETSRTYENTFYSAGLSQRCRTINRIIIRQME